MKPHPKLSIAPPYSSHRHRTLLTHSFFFSLTVPNYSSAMNTAITSRSLKLTFPRDTDTQRLTSFASVKRMKQKCSKDNMKVRNFNQESGNIAHMDLHLLYSISPVDLSSISVLAEQAALDMLCLQSEP